MTGTVNIDTSIYPPDHPYHVDTSVAAGSTAAYPTATYNVDTTTYGDVSIASSEANPYGYYDHDLAGAYYVPPTVDYTNPNPDVATDPVSYNTESNVAVASSAIDPAGDHGSGGISPEELAGEEPSVYTGKGQPYNLT